MKDLTIVVPVYNAVEETLACLRSLLASDAGKARILVLDDGSPIHVAKRLIEAMSPHENVRIVSHFRNRGYTRNVAYGVSMAKTPYVCVLNSDTLFPKTWAGPMISEMDANPTVVGVGPLSNAGSYQNVPVLHDLREGGFSVNGALGFDPQERASLSEFVRTVFGGVLVDVPILNGFCTIFRRDALERAGGFDWGAFPEGYGEENDLCIRLRGGGGRLMAAAGCFVHHQKSKSFCSDRRKVLSERGRKVLDERYGPDLLKSYTSQMEDDAVLHLIRCRVATWLDLTVEGRAMLTLSGPARLAFHTDGLQAPDVSVEEAATLAVSLRLNGPLEITLPKGVEITLLEGAPLLSALQAVALLSHVKAVHLQEWTPETLSETMRDAVTELPFGMLLVH